MHCFVQLSSKLCKRNAKSYKKMFHKPSISLPTWPYVSRGIRNSRLTLSLSLFWLRTFLWNEVLVGEVGGKVSRLLPCLTSWSDQMVNTLVVSCREVIKLHTNSSYLIWENRETVSDCVLFVPHYIWSDLFLTWLVYSVFIEKHYHK